MNKIKSIILFLIVFSIILCGTDGTIRGQVADDEGAPLIGAQIYIPQLSKGTTADVDGNYIMINIPVGWWLKKKDVSYITKKINE